MGQNFKPYEPDQLYLMPPALSEWVSEGSLARFVSDVVERLDSEGALQPFYAAYRPDGRGRAAYAPLMMVKVLLYGYCKGITSSRRLAEALESDVGFRYLAANQQPNFRTISDFRKDHLEALSGLFVRLLQLCQEAGLVKMGRVALDGTKVPGNAALAANRTRAQLEAEVTRVFEEAEATDREEDARYGVDMRGDELPEGLRTPAERAARLQAAVDRLKAEEEQAKAAQAEKIRVREEEERRQGRKKRGRKPKAPESMKDPEQRANTTDPESRIMKTQRGWVQGYNAQAAADCASQGNVAQDVTQEENDVRQLVPMLARIAEQAGERPKELLADAGANAGASGEHTELFIATQKDSRERRSRRAQGAPRGRIPKARRRGSGWSGSC